MEDKSNKVYIKRLEEYDRSALKSIIEEGMEACGYSPSGKVFVKPNVVTAHKPETIGNKACTPAEVVGTSLEVISEKPGVNRVDLGENSSMGFPTRMCYKYAGYYHEIEKFKGKAPAPVDIFCIDEEKRDEIFIGGMVHESLRVARRMARADHKVYLPKLKVHCVSNMTATVKLNVGICSDDERAIRHDFLLNEKIVDLLSVGHPDFTIMDAVDVGVGNEGFPVLRKLGLVIMGKNPIAVDLVGARLLGFSLSDLPYLARAIERGHRPESIEEVEIAGDLTSLDDIDEAAKRIGPPDDEFYRWQNVNKELDRLGSSIRFYWGPYNKGGELCKTGCVMGLKMFLASYEQYAGAEAFKNSKPCVIVIGKIDEEIDAAGNDVFLFGTCAEAEIKNARKVEKIDKCFTTVVDMSMRCRGKLGMPSMVMDPKFVLPMAQAMTGSGVHKLITGRYGQDIMHFVTKNLDRRL